MTATDAQIRIAMSERKKGKTQQQAAVTANLASRKTVAKYEQSRRLPSELKPVRQHRTRVDPFIEDWETIEGMLRDAPELEAQAVFEWLCKQHPGRYQEGQLRTLQRRFRQWRALNVSQVAILDQIRQPGEQLQVDGTWMNQLEITIGGEAFPHLFIHCVLPYSNWAWGRIAQSESLGAVQEAVGRTLVELGHVPKNVQSDNSSAATRRLGILEGKGRGYTTGWQHVCDHYGLQPTSTHVGNPNENGDVEAANGALKRALKQQLLLRGSRDFETIAAYETFLSSVLKQRNRARQVALNEELAVMKPLASTPLARQEKHVRVTSNGMIRVLNKAYTVPTSLIGHQVRVVIREWELAVYLGMQHIETLPRLIGQHKETVNYRHVVGSLLRKPGGFRRYRYREALFPQHVFRRTWEQLDAWHSSRTADLTYLRILQLAATTLECDVAFVLTRLLAGGKRFDYNDVELLVKQPTSAPAWSQPPPIIDLKQLDQLLPEVAHELH